MKNVLEVTDLFVSYDKTPVLWNISFSIDEGTITAVIGPNGAGKSTLVKSLIGLIPQMSGGVLFWGLPFSAIRKRVAYVPQKDSVDWSFPLTVRELVLMGRYGNIGLLRRPQKKDHDSALAALEKVGMVDFADRQIDALSGGQKQRLFLARALAQEADFLILDEPFQGIDMASSHMIINLLKDLKKEGKTILVVHHHLPEVEEHFDEAILLNLRLVKKGPVVEVLSPEYLAMAYGRNYYILDEAMKLSQRKGVGNPI